jgi:F-type H+-transporting ATPase subunit epsilon
MVATVHLDIVSAERQIFSGLAELVVASGYLGEVGIRYGHAPLLTSLKPGQVRVVTPGGQEEIYYVSSGILEVQPDRVSVLADTVERAENLDEKLALEAKAQAEQAMKNVHGDIEYSKAAAALAEAVAQIQAIHKLRRKLNHN